MVSLDLDGASLPLPASEECSQHEPATITRSSTFRLATKNLFLTYPRNETTKETLLSRVQKLFSKSLAWAICAEEAHSDGGGHLHAVIALTKKAYLKGTKWMKKLDKLTGKHGNYQSARNLKNTVTYVTKDGKFVSVGINVSEFTKAAAAKKSTAIATAMIAGKNLDEIHEMDPGFFMMNKRKIEDYQDYLQRKKARLDTILLKWPPSEEESMPLNSTDELIRNWLLNNLFKTRHLKQPQMYIYGDADMGKTTLINNLSKYARIYFIPPDEDFYCTYDNDSYDLAVLDEFKGQKKIQWLNGWLDGQNFPIKRKGLPALVKTKNIPTIILSNYSLENIYRKRIELVPTALDPLNTRLDVIHVTTKINYLYGDSLIVPPNNIDWEEDITTIN